MVNNKEIGARLAMRRAELNLTLQDVAKKVGIASSTVLRYESGKVQRIKLPVVEAIAKALGVNPAWVCGKSEDRFLSIEDMDDETFAKMLAAHAKPLQQMPIQFEDLDHFITHTGYHIEKVNDSYSFSGKNGVYTVTEGDLNLLLSQSKDFASYLCAKLEKKLIEENNDDHIHIEIPEPKKPNNF